jgi:hypothetical protein
MKNSGRLIFYIILNIFISAATILTVLWLWECTHPGPESAQMPAGTVVEETGISSSESISASQSTSIPDEIEWEVENPQIDIRTVVGVGNIDLEYIEVFNQSEGAVNMTGWQIVDESENRFTFPVLILNNGGSVKIYSKAGDDTVIELYWQAETPIWQSGETVRLLDADGNTAATYSIP